MPDILDEPTNLDKSRKRAYYGCAGGTCLKNFLLPIISLLSPALLEMARYGLKFGLTELLTPK